MIRKRYEVYDLGPNGPKSDTLLGSFWRYKKALNAKLSIPTAPDETVAIYDILKERWV